MFIDTFWLRKIFRKSSGFYLHLFQFKVLDERKSFKKDFVFDESGWKTLDGRQVRPLAAVWEYRVFRQLLWREKIEISVFQLLWSFLVIFGSNFQKIIFKIAQFTQRQNKNSQYLIYSPVMEVKKFSV